jgi:membrane fusion protein (multidrug efflux system)
MSTTEPAVDSPSAVPNVIDDNPPHESNKRRRLISFVLFILLLAVPAGIIAWRAFYYQNRVETDDAYIVGHPHIVSSRIDGVVEEVTVDDNDHVERGQTIVKLDPHDYEVGVSRAKARLAEAKREMLAADQTIDFTAKHAASQLYNANGAVEAAQADIQTAEASVAEAKESLAAAQADVEQADAQLVRAKLDYERFVPLEARGVVSTHDKDVAVRDYDVARAGKVAAEKRLRAAVARLKEKQEQVAAAHAELIRARGATTQAQSDAVKTDVERQVREAAAAKVKAAEAELRDAELKLYYTNVYAPVSGHIGKRTVEVGHHIVPGEQLVTVVEDYTWVVANFKETQIRRMRPGQIAYIRVDGIPDRVFTGIVDSFSPGSGSTFSLIPPDNAVGNFTKIVQRVPVKIRFEPESIKGIEDKLIVGMSVVATVDFGSAAPTTRLLKERERDNPLKKVMPYFW